MHMVMAVDMRRLAAKQLDKPTILTLQLMRDFIQRQAILFRHLPDPLPQTPSRVSPGIADKRLAQRQDKMHPDPQLRHAAAQLGRVANRRPLTSAVVEVTRPFLQASIMP
jgi:hypothetical protein